MRPLPQPLTFIRLAALAGVAGLCAAGAGAQAPRVPAADGARAEFARADALYRKGQVFDSRPVFQRAADLATRTDDRAVLQDALFGLSDVQATLSDWAGALDYAQRAYDALPDPKGAARVRYLDQRGRVLQELRERDQAFAAYHEGVELAKALGDRRLLGSLYNELGLATWRLDRNRERALQYYEEAIAIWRELANPRNEMVVLNNSGNLFRYPETYAEAERRYRAGMDAAKRAGIDGDPFLLKNLGIVLRETGRRDEALRALERAVMLADTRGNGRIQWQGRMELGTFHAATDPERAAGYFEETLKVLEGLNNNVLLEGFRAGALSGAVTIYDDPYDLYTDMLLANGREHDAFFVAERARARAFLDTLSLAREEVSRSLPTEYIAGERTILERINTNQAALRAPEVSAARRSALQAEISDDEERLNQMRVRLASDHPALAHARYPRLWKVEDIQSQLLRPDEVLLQYFVGARSGTLWVITPTGMQVKRLPPRDRIESGVRAFLEAIGRPDGDFKAQSRALATALLPDLSHLTGPSTRLIVVPHGILNYVPFEALIAAGDRFVVQDHAVSYAPSASSLAFLRSRAASGVEVMAIGNPLMRSQGAAVERSGGIARVSALKPLLHSGPEVRAVSRVFGSSARVFEEGAATEAVLTGDNASRAGIIHIATHGLIDEQMPDRSGLALTAAPPQSDGILQMREVYNLRLNAALVTLSACQTALGKSITGEGIVGLSRAFFYAGANSVLASLWNVNDASTERLMRPFYEALAGGDGIDDALRTAKLALLNEGGRLSHPYFWAAFVVTGHGAAAVPVRPASTWPTWTAEAFLGLVLLAGTIVWRRVRY